MTEDLAPRGWRNYHRSRRATEVQHDLAATAPDDTQATDWWLEDEEPSPNA